MSVWTVAPIDFGSESLKSPVVGSSTTAALRSVAFIAVLFLVVCVPNSSTGETLLVPADYDTIQSAIDEAEDNDVIEIDFGYYPENLDLLGKSVTLIGVDGPEDTIVDGADLTLGDELGSVVLVEDAVGAHIEGLTLVNGSGTEFTRGAGVLRRGGGVLVVNGDCTIVDCVIDSNDADGVHASNATVVVERSEIVDNDGSGVVGNRDAVLILSDTVIEENTALILGGGFQVDGSSELTLERCVVRDNSATWGGGGLTSGSTTVEGCEFSENSATFDGGLSIVASSDEVVVTVSGTVFKNNVASYGSGISVEGSTTVIESCEFFGNEADEYGAAILAGDGLGSVDVDRCTIVNNTAADGIVRAGLAGNLTSEMVVTVTNSIIWDNGDDPICGQVEQVAIDYTLVEGGFDGTDNLDEDPLFAAALSDDYRLLPDSPCLDAGDPDVADSDGTVVDMGRYPSLSFLRGDVNGNGAVTPLLDALTLMQWAFASGVAPGCVDASDADDNGVVSALVDSLYLLEWGFSGGDDPPDPGHLDCGRDADQDDDLGCEAPPECT